MKMIDYSPQHMSDLVKTVNKTHGVKFDNPSFSDRLCKNSLFRRVFNLD